VTALPTTQPAATVVGATHETAASAKHSVGALAPAPTHTICGWCNVVLSGDPKTVAKPGALVSTGICPACQAKQIDPNATDVQRLQQLASHLNASLQRVEESITAILTTQQDTGWPELDELRDAFAEVLKSAQDFAHFAQNTEIAFSYANLRKAQAPKRIQSSLP
jgi:hypothetical protein